MGASESDQSLVCEDIEMSSSTNSSSDEENLRLLRAVATLPRRPRQRRLFERINPMEKYDNDDFIKRFRFPKEIVCEIAELLKENLAYHDNRNNPFPVLIQVLICLRYYAVGSFQIVSGDLFGVHQVTCGRVAKRVAVALGMLAKSFIKKPATNEQVAIVKNNFYDRFGFPNVLGIVDGTLIPIFSPGGNNAENFRSRKGFFAINTQVVCDSDFKFTSIDERWPGSTHDQTVFNFSYLFEKLEHDVYSDGYLLGDAGYGCRKYLLTPVPNAVTDGEKSSLLEISVDVHFAVIIIVSTAFLHNIAIEKNVILPPQTEEPNLNLGDNESRQQRIGRFRGNDTSVRDAVISNFFST